MRLLPHIPALCKDCYALLTPGERRVADVVRRLIIDRPLNGQHFYIPTRTPLCLQGLTEPARFVIDEDAEHASAD